MNLLSIRIARWIAPLAVAASLLGCGGASVGNRASKAWILDANNHLRKIRLDTGALDGPVVTITGLQAGEVIVAIDMRLANNELYGIGSTGRLYRLNTIFGGAFEIGSGAAGTISGTNFGMDINPSVDRMRLVSDADQNLRLDPDTSTVVVDTALTYAPGDVNAGVNPTVTDIAYSNNFLSAPITTAYALDSGTDTLVAIGGVGGTPSANGGLLTTIGSLGIDIGPEGGMDISGTSTSAYAALAIVGNTESTLCRIDLATGTVTQIAPIATGALTRDIALIP